MCKHIILRNAYMRSLRLCRCITHYITERMHALPTALSLHNTLYYGTHACVPYGFVVA